MLGQVRQCDLYPVPPLFVRQLWNHRPHRLLRLVAQNPRRLPVSIAINLPALGIAAR